MLLSRAGTFISHPDEQFILAESIFSLADQYQRPELKAIGYRMIAGVSEIESIRDYQSGEPQWIFAMPVPSTRWTFAARVSQAQAMREVYGRMWQNLAVFVAGFALMVLVVLVMTAWITRPPGAAGRGGPSRGRRRPFDAGGERYEP